MARPSRSDRRHRALASAQPLDALLAEIRACRICVETPRGTPLPHEPRPVLRASKTARIAIAGQAPGSRVHRSGVPLTDPSGVRLRDWMGVDDTEFYDETRVAILPMGFCFPGLDANGGDRPPRKECALHWRSRLMAALPQIELILLVGAYAHHWHLAERPRRSASAVVRDFEAILAGPGPPRQFPLPHPSWRNNAWIAANPWFTADVLPCLKSEVRRLL